MAEDIFTGRTEKRFLIPKDKTEILIKSLTGFELFCPNGMVSTYLQSVYFGRHGDVNKNGLIRVRRYKDAKQHTNELFFEKDDEVYFEVKYKQGEKIDKKRFLVNYGEVVEKLSQPSEMVDWLVEKTGLREQEAKLLHEEFDFLELYPQFAIITERTHHHSTDTCINSRVTVDRDIKYFAFKYGEPYRGIEMGSESMDKLEVKVDEKSLDLITEIQHKIIKLGGLSIDTLQGKVEGLCKETVKLLSWMKPSKETNNSIESTPMHSLRNMENVFVNEFIGEEFEMKIQIQPLEPQKLIDEIKKRLATGSIKEFSAIKDKQEVSFWIYFMDYYGYLDNGKTKVAFSVIRHPDKDKFMVQFKDGFDKHGNDEEFVIARKEFKFRVERKFQKTDLDILLAYYQSLVGLPVSYIGTNRRKKYYIFLFNEKSQRYYNLSIDLNNCNGEEMVQLEIEYKGKHPDSTVANDKNAVLEEITKLSSEIKKIPDFEFTTTELRKFDWIKSLNGIK